VKIIKTEIPDVLIIEPRLFKDERGYFLETWNQRAFNEAGIAARFVQDNQSRSVRHTLRGLHYQIKQPQGKLVRVTRGEVFDVAVDLRKNSTTFGKWVGRKLSEENKHMMWIPPGFAHGFCTLSDVADFQYKCTEFYAPEYERTIYWADSFLLIDWNMTDGAQPIISDKDKMGVCFEAAEYYNITNGEWETPPRLR